jgi:hypothetical protein
VTLKDNLMVLSLRAMIVQFIILMCLAGTCSVQTIPTRLLTSDLLAFCFAGFLCEYTLASRGVQLITLPFLDALWTCVSQPRWMFTNTEPSQIEQE